MLKKRNLTCDVVEAPRDQIMDFFPPYIAIGQLLLITVIKIIEKCGLDSPVSRGVM
jgi:hypothetical protein